MALLGLFNRKTSLFASGALKGAVDRHSHILYGVDDGVKTLEDSLEALSIEESMGISEVWLTPHVMEDVPNASDALKERFDQLLESYTGGLRLHLAAEYMIDTLFESRLSSGDLLVMEDDRLLVETSTWTPPIDFMDRLREIQKAGYRPLLAHPERYRYLSQKDYEELVKLGIGLQLNLPSIVGYYGKTALEKASWLLDKGYYTDFGTDCHRPKALLEPYRKDLLSKSDMNNLKRI